MSGICTPKTFLMPCIELIEREREGCVVGEKVEDGGGVLFSFFFLSLFPFPFFFFFASTSLLLKNGFFVGIRYSH